jgi:hypothetical protein
MDRPSRLSVDCPRCENHGVVPLDDNRTIACPLCNNWCTLCLEGVPTFVPIIRPYCGSLIGRYCRSLMARRCLRATPVTITRRRFVATPTLRRRWWIAMRPASGHAPSRTIPTFRAWLECAGTTPARCLAGRFAADESASDDWRMKEWPLFCAIRHQPRGACLLHHATCGERISPSYLTPAPTWRRSKRWSVMKA